MGKRDYATWINLERLGTKDGSLPERQYVNDGNINCTRWLRGQMNTFYVESLAEEPQKYSLGSKLIWILA